MSGVLRLVSHCMPACLISCCLVRSINFIQVLRDFSIHATSAVYILLVVFKYYNWIVLKSYLHVEGQKPLT